MTRLFGVAALLALLLGSQARAQPAGPQCRPAGDPVAAVALPAADLAECARSGDDGPPVVHTCVLRGKDAEFIAWCPRSETRHYAERGPIR